MIPAAAPRTIAIALLRFAIWIAPHDTHDWGHAMLNELHHVEGNWPALIWALGGAGVLAKHAIVALILPGTQRRTIATASELFEKEGHMRKTTLAVIVSCIAASLLLFIAPVFRQAFRVSLAQWHEIFHVGFDIDGQNIDPELAALGKKAEQNHDAEALAFVAVRTSNQSESARLADEAVHLDPKLTWIYALVAVQHPEIPAIDRWVPELQKFDPQNALPYLIAAEKIDIDQVKSREVIKPADAQSPAWQAAMASAFRSSKLDAYSSRLKQLDRSVVLRYRIDDPFQALEDPYLYGLPSYGAWDSYRYAKSLIESAGTLESRGERKGAGEIYLSVARFGQLLEPDGGYFISSEVKEAYKRLAASSAKDGNSAEAAFYAALSDHVDQVAEKQRATWRSRAQGDTSIPGWNAFLIRVAGLSMLFCGGILAVCVLGVVVRARSVAPSALRPSRPTVALAFTSAIGALLSSAVLFASYWPYSQLFQRFVRTGDDFHLSELSAFLGDTQLPLGSQFSMGSWYVGSQNAVFYFWFGVSILCAVAIGIAVFRHYKTRHRVHAAA